VGSGLNDNLNGVEMPVSFHLSKLNKDVEIVQSLAKWKRYALNKYSFPVGMGIYTDMNAIRAEEETDNIHSIYVDQWDWEKVITEKDRVVEYLKSTVQSIVNCIADTNDILRKAYPILNFQFERECYFITSQELLEMYPDLSPKERENEICRVKKTVFIIGIGQKLSNGEPHDNRSPDYDDWTLNGDILVYYPVLDMAVELSSMGIRVDYKALFEQLQLANAMDRLKYPFHQGIVHGQLPLTIGGGIGQSRLCLILLEKFHIGEVQVSTWNEEDIKVANNYLAQIL